MRVIHELVAVLRAQGRLDDATLRRLEQAGYLPSTEPSSLGFQFTPAPPRDPSRVR